MSIVNYKTLNRFFDYDEIDLNMNRIRRGQYTVEELEDIIFKYYRKYGFPYYKFTPEQKNRIMKKLIRYDYNSLLLEDDIKQTMHGLSLAWSYFPHSWSVKCNDMLTPMEVFNNDELFRKFIKKYIQLSKPSAMNRPLTCAQFRKVIKIMTGVQSVSNFRPTAAGCIYEHFGGNGVVWDMSCGFGGRLLGALSSKRVKHYIGTDPSSRVFDGLVQIRKDFSWINKKVDIYKMGSESFIPKKNSLDLAFTSPPYFNTEKYSDELTQSYIKYPNPDEWKNNFLRTTIENCYVGLKKDGLMILNVADVKSYLNLIEDTLKLARECGFTYIRTLNYLLSNINKGGFKSESCFMFKK